MRLFLQVQLHLQIIFSEQHTIYSCCAQGRRMPFQRPRQDPFSAPPQFMTPCDQPYHDLCKIAHGLYVVYVNRYILFAHLKITGGT